MADEMTEVQKVEHARSFIAEAEDFATMASDIVLRFRAVAADDTQGRKEGIVITRDLIDKMRKGALDALDPDADLDGANISEIRTTGYSFKQALTGRQVKAHLRKMLPETKAKKPAKKRARGKAKR